MNTNRNPESMTAGERRAEVACILARGLIRSVRMAKIRASSPEKILPESRQHGLELCGDPSVTVAQRAAG